MSWIDIVLLLLLALCIVWAVRKIVRHQTGGCSGDCAHCGKGCENKKE